VNDPASVLLARVNLLCQSALKVPILEWAEENIRYPHSDRSYRFRRDVSYWLNWPLEAITSGFWRVVSIMAPTGGSKTTLLETLVSYIVAVDPGATLIVGQSDVDVSDFAEVRLMPMLNSIESVVALLPESRHQKRKTEIIFPHMPLYLGGANLNTLQSKSCRWVILDEVWLMKRSMVREAMGRTHDRENSVVLALGQAGVVNDEHDRLHESCAKHEYGWTCPECSTWNNYSFRHLKYENTRNEHGVWDWRGLAESVRMDCPKCETQFTDTEDNRRLLSASGTYRPLPCNPVPGRLAVHYHAAAVWWIAWSTLVIEFVQANARKKEGDYEPLRQWIQKRCAAPWADDDAAPEVTFQASGYTQAEHEDGQPIENEARRFLTVDVQRDDFWAVVRAWRADGSSRLLFAGRLVEWSQIPGLAERYKIAAVLVFLDARYNTEAVYSFCAAHGFIALQGDQAADFTHRRGRQAVKRFYSAVVKINLGGKGTALLVRWSSERIKDILGRLVAGKGPAFEIPSDCMAEYADHMTAEIKRDVIDPRTRELVQRWKKIGRRANHLWDCEAMQVCAALMMRLLRLGEPEPEPAPAADS
jgi:hypothetical protein